VNDLSVIQLVPNPHIALHCSGEAVHVLGPVAIQLYILINWCAVRGQGLRAQYRRGPRAPHIEKRADDDRGVLKRYLGTVYD
jgi:hypothetical protein